MRGARRLAVTFTRATLLPWVCAALSACAVESSLGRHERALLADGEPRDVQAQDAATTAPHAAREAVPIDRPALDAGGTPEPAPETHADASLHEPPPTEPPPAEPPPAEPPPAEPPPEVPPVVDPPPELPMVCTAATDNPCHLCEQDACCDALFACSEHEACKCRRECRGVAEPAACAEGCGAVPDALATLDACLAEHCADHCTL